MKALSLSVLVSLTIICAGCGTLDFFFDPLDKAMTRAETDIDQTARRIHDDTGNATAELENLATRLSHDTHQEIQFASAQVHQIATDTVQLTGEEARCTMKYAGMSAEVKLRNILHSWKKQPLETTALLCSIKPSPIMLGENPSSLTISGAWLDTSKPEIETVIVDPQGHVLYKKVPDATKYLALSTEYSETVRLDTLRQDGILTEDVRTLHLVFAGIRNGLGEIPVIPSPTCTDKIRNGLETDVDCGGSMCSRCAPRKMCTQASDCSSNTCIAGICGAHRVRAGLNPVERDYGGGTGGDRNETTSCPTNTVAMGYRIHAGKYIDKIGLNCRSITQNGELEGSTFLSPDIGDNGGHDEGDVSCPIAGTVLVGFHGWTGDRVDSIQGYCLPLLEVSNRASQRHESETRLYRHPDSRGDLRTVYCQNDNEVVTEIHVRHGEEMDHLYFRCTALETFVPAP